MPTETVTGIGWRERWGKMASIYWKKNLLVSQYGWQECPMRVGCVDIPVVLVRVRFPVGIWDVAVSHDFLQSHQANGSKKTLLCLSLSSGDVIYHDVPLVYLNALTKKDSSFLSPSMSFSPSLCVWVNLASFFIAASQNGAGMGSVVWFSPHGNGIPGW